MPPKKRGRPSLASSAAAAGQEDDAMEVELSQGANQNSANAAPTPHPTVDLSSPWTDDQVASLFKGVIRYKPAGMHKHFRMIAISEHLRNHGFDPNLLPHTRIPGIWAKLRNFYNLEVIDDRENNILDDESLEKRWFEFRLPIAEYHDLQDQRRYANTEGDDEEPGTSPPQWDPNESPPRKKSAPPHATGKRKRGERHSKARSSTVDDTEDEPASSPPPAKSTRGGRGGRRRANTRTKIDVPEEEEEDDDDQDDEDRDDDDEGSAEEEEDSSAEDGSDKESEAAAPVVKSTRGGRGRGRGGRGRGRGRWGKRARGG